MARKKVVPGKKGSSALVETRRSPISQKRRRLSSELELGAQEKHRKQRGKVAEPRVSIPLPSKKAHQ